MKRFTLILILAFFAFLVPSTEIAFAEGGIAWPESMPICEASETQRNIRMVPDGSGGAIIVWQDYRNGGIADIYAQRINENGDPLWADNGVLVCTNTARREHPVIVGDDFGGAIIAWEDYSGVKPNIYALRISSAGYTYTGWIGNGKVLKFTSTDDQLSPEIVSNGFNGAIIVWQEISGSQYSIYAHGIDGDGNDMWAASVAVSSGTAFKGYPKLIKSDSDNVIVTWQDERNGDSDIYAQRIDIFTNVIYWDINGSTVTIALDNQLEPQIVSDGSGGAIITWTDYRPSTLSPDIYAQRIDFSGTRVWTNNGIPVCEEINGQYRPVITNHFIGVEIEGAIIAWEDMRSGDVDIYAGRVDLNGYVDGSEMPFATGSGPQKYPRLVSDSQGGGIIGTALEYEGSSSKIFANKRDEYGQLVWSSYPGVLVCEGTEIDYDYQIISDGYGGAIVAWVGKEVAADDFNIFAQRVVDDAVMWISVPISGRVTLSDGVTGITGVEIEALEDGELVSSVTTDTNGDYELAVVAGSTYTVRATWMYNGIESSVSMKAFAPSYYFDFTLEIYSLLGTIAGNVSGVEEKYVASFSRPELKRISNSGLQKILSPGSGIAFVELEQRDKVIVKVPVEMEGDYSIPNLLPGRFIARAYNGTIYSNPRTVNLKEGETFKVNFVFSTIPKETVFNYPNPAKSGSTTIRYYCGYSDPEAEIKIYNITGELVKKVRDSEIDDTDAPIYKFLWDCKNDSGKEVASSIYIYIVEVKEKSSGETKKVIKRLAVLR